MKVEKMVLDEQTHRPLIDARNHFMTCIGENDYGALFEYITIMEHYANKK
jgi:hypothetical protein